MTKDEEIALLRQALERASHCANYMASGMTHSGPETLRAQTIKAIVDSALEATAKSDLVS